MGVDVRCINCKRVIDSKKSRYLMGVFLCDDCFNKGIRLTFNGKRIVIVNLYDCGDKIPYISYY